MWLHRSIRLVLMLLCIALGVVASLAYAKTTFTAFSRSKLLPIVVSSFCVSLAAPMAMVLETHWVQISRGVLLLTYAFHVAASVVAAVEFTENPLNWDPGHVPAVVLSLALGSCLLMGASAVLILQPPAPAAGDAESASTVCSEQLSLNKTHERQEIGNKASQKTLVNGPESRMVRDEGRRDPSGSTLHEEQEMEYELRGHSTRRTEDQGLHDQKAREHRFLKASLNQNVHQHSHSQHFQNQNEHNDGLCLCTRCHEPAGAEVRRFSQNGESRYHGDSRFNTNDPKLSQTTPRESSDDPDLLLVQALIASQSPLNDYCLSNWMSPSLGHISHFPSLPQISHEPSKSTTSIADVHRLKLAGLLLVKKIRDSRRGKWQLIHDEKAFLQNVNENLLPSVLRLGVSPVQKSKSRFSFEGQETREDLKGLEDPRSENPKSEIERPRESEEFPDILEGLEEIPAASPPPWAQQGPGLRLISLNDWEQNKHQWLQQNYINKRATAFSESARPISFVLASASAPSLHTYRRNSEGSNCREVYSQEVFENVLTHCVTPTPRAPELPAQSTNSSPIRKVMGMFRRRGSEVESFSFPYKPPKSHKHLDSVAASMNSHPLSTASGKSSRSGLPRKAIKLFLLGHGLLHKLGSSFTYTPNNPPPVPPAPPPIPILFNMPKDPLFRHTAELAQPFRIPSDEWEMSDVTGLDQSRVSSLPSAIIGEYDKEKWRKLKELEARQAA